MKTAAERIDDLMKIHPKGFDLSLDRVTGLLEKLGNPQNKMPPVLHFAGTNGKGSAIAFSRAILEAAGLSVHVHTSPHLVDWPERYRIGRAGEPGTLVEDAVLSDAIRRVAEANDGQAITVFEVLSAVMFVLFSEHPADVCLVEVGLGGRFDATNVMEQTAVSVITPVSLDHEAYLGDTLAKIAFEKAGIIKRRTPVIVGPQERDALDVIEKQARKMGAATQINGEQYHASRENGRMIFQDEERLLDLALPRLPGIHQIDNAATAIAACLQFAKDNGYDITPDHIDAGLQSAAWPGRMQKLTTGALLKGLESDAEIWLDGGHNPGAAAMIANFFGELQAKDTRDFVIICGMLTTKDPSGYFDQLQNLSPEVITVPITSSDAGFGADDLAAHARKSGLEAKQSTSLKGAFAALEGRKNLRILVAGSLYLVGDALAHNETPPA